MEKELTVDAAIDALADIYWMQLVEGMAKQDIDKIYDAAIALKATEVTRIEMKQKFEGNR